jgi:hypothetical protein
MDVRQAAARAECAVERLAEPLSALFLPAERWPAALLDEAWRDLILNSAHDSVCACSIDEVCDAVLHRYAEATDIADGLADRALAHLATRVRHDGPLVVNPTARPRGGVVRLTLPIADAPRGTQLLRSRPAESVVLEGPPEQVVPAAEELEWARTITGFSLESAGGEELVSARREGTGSLVSPYTRVALAGVAHPGPLRLRVHQPAQVTVLAYVNELAGFGWRGWNAGDVDPGVPAVAVADGEGADAAPTLANGIVTVAVNPVDGTYSLGDHAGLGRLVDGGDCGDTYNWCPPARDTLVDRPDSVDVTVVERGPLRARVRVVARYRWPARAEGLEARTGEVAHEVVTRLELRAGDRALRVETTIDNRSRDHRLRAHFPLPTPTGGSRAETAFGTVERGLEAEGGPTEAPLATYPALRFVQAGGLTVVHDGVAEYELVGIHGGRAHELALTLLRCTGMLSQVPMPTRPLPAGPLIRMEGPQLQRRLTRRYAVAVGGVDPFALADEMLVSLQVVPPSEGTGAWDAARAARAVDVADADLPAAGSALAVEGAVVSAVTREGGGLAVRVFNPRDEPAEVRIDGRHGWLVDLRGRPLGPFEGSFTLRPWGIATAALSD